MSDTVKIVAGTSVIWGTDGCTIGTGTIVSDCTITSEGETKEIANNKGNTVEVVQFNDKKTLSMTILAISGATPPARGGVVTVGTKGTFLVEKVGEPYKRGEEAYYTLDGNSWENVTLSAGA